MSPNNLNQLDNIKDHFVQEWLEGRRPTLSAYVAQYPEFSEELSEFVMDFAQLHSTPLELSEPTVEGRKAMLRGVSASRTKARTIADRMTELGMGDLDLAKLIRAPIELLALFHRTHVEAVPESFWKQLAKALSLTEMQGRQMLAPRGLVYRSKNQPSAQPRQFAEILGELHQKGLISEEDYQFWSAEGDSE